MDSIKKNALKLKGIAEKRILDKDYTGARNNIIKVQQIFPDFENVPQMLVVCDILCAADMEFPGCGIDWYWVLQLPPSADDFDIVSQYQKLVALLESIKNNFPGTESAMKFIGEAFSVLSDQSKRSMFDLKRSASRKGSRLIDSGSSMVSETTDVEENAMGGSCSPPSSSMCKTAAAVEVSDESNERITASELPSKGPRDLGKRVAFNEVSDVRNQSSLLGKLPFKNLDSGAVDSFTRITASELPSKRPRDLGKRVSLDQVSDESNRSSILFELPLMSRDSGGVDSFMGRMVDNDVRFEGLEELPAVHVIGRKKEFTKDQIWAVFGGSDAMPRQYVKVNNVISASIVSVTYLEPHPMHDDEIRWVEENLPLVCGIFRIGSSTTSLGASKFSHLVDCECSTKKSFYRIYPREGEIWAMYKNWHNKWDFPNQNGYQCHIVEILQDIDEEVGLSVCKLVRVNGSLTFFRRQSCEGFDLVRSLSRTEMLSFSHRIPASTVLGNERHGIPKGSLHLEPDALPLNVC